MAKYAFLNDCFDRFQCTDKLIMIIDKECSGQICLLIQMQKVFNM